MVAAALLRYHCLMFSVEPTTFIEATIEIAKWRLQNILQKGVSRILHTSASSAFV